MENETEIVKGIFRIGVIGGIDHIADIIENETYEQFKANKEEYKKSFLASLNYLCTDFVSETFNCISENKKLEKNKQKTIYDICFKLYKEWEKEYIEYNQRLDNGNKLN